MKKLRRFVVTETRVTQYAYRISAESKGMAIVKVNYIHPESPLVTKIGDMRRYEAELAKK